MGVGREASVAAHGRPAAHRAGVAHQSGDEHRLGSSAAGPWVWVAAAVLVVFSVFAEFRRRNTEGSSTATSEQDPYQALADAVFSELEREERHQRLLDPDPIPVTWTTEGPPVSDHWSMIRSDGVDERIDLGGRFGGLREVLDDSRIRSRLVVLGAPGSGKTAMLIRLALDLLRTDGLDQRVPVYLRMSTWNPDESSLNDWRISVARLVLILDGFDEMADLRSPGLAISALNHSLRKDAKVVISSRRDDYVMTIDSTDSDVLTAAAVLLIRPLTVAAVEHYPTAATRPSVAWRWRDFFSADTERFDGRAADALSAPLWVSLARIAYADRGTDQARMHEPTAGYGAITRLNAGSASSPPTSGTDW